MSDLWAFGSFLIAMPRKPYPVDGKVYRGLGLHLALAASPKGRRPAIWALTHLGSGHCIARLYGDEATVLPIASEIAEAGDWNFDGLQGWRNHFPDARDVVHAIVARAGKRSDMGSGSKYHCEDVAREIAMARPA